MINFIIKTSTCVVALISCFVLLFAYFVNTFYVNEEIIDIPILQPSQISEKILPENKEKNKNELTFKILHGDKTKNDEKKLILKKNVPELVPFNFEKKNNKDENKLTKKIDINNKNNIDKSKKQNITKDKEKVSNLKKYRVQLGSFKNKDKAIRAIKDIEINFPQIFKNQDLEIFTIEKENYTFHRVWTKLMLKNGALDLCKSLKKIKVNCILQIDEG